MVASIGKIASPSQTIPVFGRPDDDPIRNRSRVQRRNKLQLNNPPGRLSRASFAVSSYTTHGAASTSQFGATSSVYGKQQTIACISS